MSLFPLDYHSKTVLGVYHEEWNLENVIPLLEHEPFISVLQMPDATRIPKRIFNSLVMYGPTITVEIKPKQGFYQKHPNIDIPYCNNCILQVSNAHIIVITVHFSWRNVSPNHLKECMITVPWSCTVETFIEWWGQFLLSSENLIGISESSTMEIVFMKIMVISLPWGHWSWVCSRIRTLAP